MARIWSRSEIGAVCEWLRFRSSCTGLCGLLYSLVQCNRRHHQERNVHYVQAMHIYELTFCTISSASGFKSKFLLILGMTKIVHIVNLPFIYFNGSYFSDNSCHVFIFVFSLGNKVLPFALYFGSFFCLCFYKD